MGSNTDFTHAKGLSTATFALLGLGLLLAAALSPGVLLSPGTSQVKVPSALRTDGRADRPLAIYAWMSPNGTLGTDWRNTLSFTLSATGGSGTYDFYDYYVNGTLVQTSPTPWILNYQFLGTGTYVINGSVTDSTGAHASSNVATVTVHWQLSDSISLRSPFIDLGVSEMAMSWAHNGTPPYWVNMSGCPVDALNHSQCWVNGTAVGSYLIMSNATDHAGYTASALDFIVVNPHPRVWLNATSNITNVGTKDTLLAARKGGTNGDAGSNFPYNWSGCPVATGGMSACNFNVSAPGVYHVTVWYNDSWQSSSASLNITVRPGISASILSTYPAVDVGMLDHFSASVHNGTAPYSYVWSTGCSPWNGAACNLTTSSVGVENVSLTVSDALGHWASAYDHLTVNPLPSASINGPGVVDANKTAVLSFHPSGGTGPLTLTFPSGCLALNATTCMWTAPAMHGYASISATVSDLFRTEFVNGSLLVLWGPHVGWQGGRTHLDLGMNTTLTTWLGLPPQPPYANWSFYLNGGQVQNGNRSSYFFDPTLAGSFTFVCHETDIYGETASTGPLTVTVYPSLGVRISASSSVGIDASTPFQAVIQGGQGPYTVVWAPAGPVTQAYQGWNATFSWRSAGTYDVNLTVTDALGGSATTTMRVSVGLGSSSTSSSSSSFPELYAIVGVGAVVAVVALALVALLYVRRRKRGGGTAPLQDASSTPPAPTAAETPAAEAPKGSGGAPEAPSDAGTDRPPLPTK